MVETDSGGQWIYIYRQEDRPGGCFSDSGYISPHASPVFVEACESMRWIDVCVHQASIIVQPDQSNVGYFIFWFSTKLLSVQKRNGNGCTECLAIVCVCVGRQAWHCPDQWMDAWWPGFCVCKVGLAVEESSSSSFSIDPSSAWMTDGRLVCLLARWLAWMVWPCSIES